MLQAQKGYFLDGYLWPRPNEKEALEDRYVPLALAFLLLFISQFFVQTPCKRIILAHSTSIEIDKECILAGCPDTTYLIQQYRLFCRVRHQTTSIWFPWRDLKGLDWQLNYELNLHRNLYMSLHFIVTLYFRSSSSALEN